MPRSMGELMFFFIYQLPAGSKDFANSDFYLSLVILLSKSCACGTRNVLGCGVQARSCK